MNENDGVIGLSIRKLVKVEWSDERERALSARVNRARRNRRAAKVGAVGTIAAVLVAGAMFFRTRLADETAGSKAPFAVAAGANSTTPADARDVVIGRLRIAEPVVSSGLNHHSARRDFWSLDPRSLQSELAGARMDGGGARLLVGDRVLLGDDRVGALLKVADDARASGRWGDAVAPLDEIVHSHSDDARAPLAAFSLGRVLERMNRMHEAARAFADAARLDSDGPLAVDARRHEAEARAKE